MCVYVCKYFSSLFFPPVALWDTTDHAPDVRAPHGWKPINSPDLRSPGCTIYAVAAAGMQLHRVYEKRIGKTFDLHRVSGEKKYKYI